MALGSPLPPVIAITGPSGSGKTTLIEKLIRWFTAQGIRVGAVKRSHHQIDLDREGKDSFRLRSAGANPVALTGGGFFFYTEKRADPPAPAEIASLFSGKADIVIMEGFKSEPTPRLQFSALAGMAEKNDNYVVGFITEETGSDLPRDFNGKPVFNRDDERLIGQWLTGSFIPVGRKDI
jgi:molybdopterin-guanine dinucleotide biosynthesis protein MobB